ncbi:FG-GAP-like repeat-containing protein [Ekhidna sp. To15]|uniref:T9SS type A sorting domain-containing protein n=1 Tax=Ekhidna sp. To15 TaxID=3395267 RepID=UPI003F520E28
MKNSLYQSLLSRLKNKHAKLASRFHKNVKDGEFQKQHYRKRKDSVERIKSIEKRIADLGQKSGFKPRLNYKHWAVALAMGVVVSANAQQESKTDFKSRLKNQAKIKNADVQPLAQSIFFDPKVSLGASRFSVVHTGDIDGDGDIDAIYVAYIDSPLILRNDGSFNFTVSALTTQPLEIVDNTILADFDGDGDLDLFMQNGTYGSFTTQMWINDGTGYFVAQASSFPSVDLDDDGLFAVDIDGDSDLDIIAETSQDGPTYNDYVTVFENVSMNFPDSTGLKGSDPSYVSSRLLTVMDVDGDTDEDIVYTSFITSFGQGIQVLGNDGSGNFTDSNTAFSPSYSFNDRATPLDFDNDGDLELAGFLSAPYVAVRPLENDGTILNDASTNFSEVSNVILSSSGDGDDVFALKMDTDNFDDMVALTQDSVFILISNGSGGFTEQVKFKGQAKPADLDLDGDGDLFYFDGNVSIRDNQGGGTFVQGSDILTISATYDTQLVDLDGDGDLDLAQGGSAVSRTWLNDGSGNFTVQQEFPGGAYHLAFGNLDADSDLDMVVALESDGGYPGFIIYTNDGSGNLSYNSNLGIGLETKQIELADMDEDGDLDIVVRLNGASNEYVRIYDNLGSLSFSMSSSYTVTSEKMDLGNLDGDTDLDVVLAREESGILSLTNNNGILELGQTFTGGYISDVDIADFDGDGDMDVFASNSYESMTTESYVVINDMGVFTGGSNLETGGTYGSFIGDLDGDGDIDIISGGYISNPKVWVNDGSANFAFDHDIPTIVTEYSSINIGDLDGDSDMDIVIGDYYGGTQIFFNIGTVTALEADANALTSLFDNMGGSNWTNSANWGDADVSTWFGVTLNSAQDRVERIELPNNGLVGTLPAAIDQLDALEILDFSNNEIDALATDFSGLTNAVDINLNGNELDFGDLEAVAGVSVLSYTSQAPVDAINEASVEIPVGSTQELTSSANGTANTYRWLLNGANVTGATGVSYTVTDIDRTNMGEYSLEISNTIATGTTLTSVPVDVLATALISVDVTDESETLIAENVDGYILEIIDGQVGYDTIKSATREDVASSFTFPPIVLGDFLVSITSEQDLYVPTYFGDAFLWDEADVLQLNNDTDIQIIMTETPRELTAADGDGLVDGTIEEDFEDDEGRIDARRRASKRKCGLRRKRSGGRTEQNADEFELIAYGETNDNGEFEYGFLPEGTYRFFVEYPGIPLDDSAFVQFDVGAAGIGDNSFKLAVFASEDGIFIELVLGLTSPHFTSFKIYPNPTADVININYDQVKSGKIFLEVFDIQGQEMLRKTLDRKQENITIDISDFEKGQYIFRVIDENRKDLVVYKIIKN